MKLVKARYEIERLPPREEVLLYLERAGRTCRKSEENITGESASRFVRNLVRCGHWSVIEHVSASVRFITSRGVTHELVRHRLASYSQESTRYCNYYGELYVIDPSYWPEGDPRRLRYIGHAQACEEAYKDLLAQGARIDEARDVLPIGLKTEIVVTANLREWFHIFSLRTSKAAHAAMREVMVPLATEFRRHLPEIYESLINLSTCDEFHSWRSRHE